jgi:hypothetical protein
LVRRLAAGALAWVAACVDADYHCASDRDCDLGTAGRCELDHRCTEIDPSCATNRRYSEHSGPRSVSCFDDRAVPANLCAAGQPPAAVDQTATPDPCIQNVCDALPSCCAAGWSEACVQQAQLRCAELRCDTRIAITASKPGATELWDLRWDGREWTARADPRQSVLAWLAPAAGELAPQLAGFMAGALALDDASFPVAATHSYVEATSVDFDRDGRPTAVLAFTDNRGARLEVTKLDDGTSREIASAGTTHLSWGDVDRDGFPDGIAEAGATNRYHLLSNIEGPNHQRAIDDRVLTNVTGGTSGTGGIPPALRSFDWIDFDTDRRLDVIAFGFSIDVHLGKGEAIGTSALIRIDCDPPRASSGCDAMVQAGQAFAGAALPATSGGQAVVIATYPVRALYRSAIRGSPTNTMLSPYTFPAATCGASCPPIIAVVVRDLDGDHELDVVAIDADLQVFVGLAKDNLALRAAFQVPTAPAAGFAALRTSVAGAPR